jgi:hypothetical protein
MMQGHGCAAACPDSLDEAKAAFRAAWERPLSTIPTLTTLTRNFLS